MNKTITMYMCTVLYNELSNSPLPAGTVFWSSVPQFQCENSPDHIIGTDIEITLTCDEPTWDGVSVYCDGNTIMAILPNGKHHILSTV